VQDPELGRFLSAAPSNRAVVTDWLMMEAYKGDTARSIHRSMGVLAAHPRQVVVLRNTGPCMHRRVGPQMANRLIWPQITRTFPEFMQQLAAARDGDALIAHMILERGAIATRRMQDLLEGADHFMEGHRVMFAGLTRGDVAAIRGDSRVPPDILTRVFGIAQDISAGLRGSLEPPVPAPSGKELVNDFLFRTGLAMTSSFLEWVRTGSPEPVRPEKVRNDFVDTMLSVYGTYFNGLMTGDARLHRVHGMNRELLGAMGASLPRAYGASAGGQGRGGGAG